MAGLGTKLFIQGDTLSADDVNGYFMSQAVVKFTTANARDLAFGDGIPVSQNGSGKPALSAGMICFVQYESDGITQLNQIQYYNGSSWQAADQFTLNDGQVTTVKIANGAITSDKIAADTVIAADIAAGAVDTSELADGSVTTIKIADSNVTTAKIADSAITSAKIADGAITNDDVNASAAIAHSKLANATAGQVLLGTTTTGVITATTISGDVTITGAGVTAIGSGVIVNADVNASAAIDKTKISGTAITAADTGTVTSTMIADGTIVNADINAAAAIDKTKILGTAITAADTGTVTSTMIADGTIVNADVSAAAAIDLGKLADATIDEKSASYTLVLTDKNKFIKMNVTTTANTVTVPTNASVAWPVGSQIHIIQYGTGKTQVIPVSGTVTIYATPGTYLRAQYSSATLLKCGTNIWMLMGDLSAT